MSDWGEGFRRDLERRSSRVEPARPPAAAQDGLPVVLWVPVFCSYCGARRSKIDHTAGLVRFHTCAECGGRFKSIEEWAAPVSRAQPTGEDPPRS